MSTNNNHEGNVRQVEDTIRELAGMLSMEMEGTNIAGKNPNGKQTRSSRTDNNNRNNKRNSNGVQNGKNEIKVNAEPEAHSTQHNRRNQKSANPYASAVPVSDEELARHAASEPSPDINRTNESRSGPKSSRQEVRTPAPANNTQNGSENNPWNPAEESQKNSEQNHSSRKEDAINNPAVTSGTAPASGTSSDASSNRGDTSPSQKEQPSIYKNQLPKRKEPEEHYPKPQSDKQPVQQVAEQPVESPSVELQRKLDKNLSDMRRKTSATREELERGFAKLGNGNPESLGVQITKDEAENIQKKNGSRATIIIKTRIVDSNGNPVANIDRDNYNPSIPLQNKVISAQLINMDTGECYDIDSKFATIGKGSNMDCRINEHYISRSHALITKHDNEYFIEDTNSTNGTYVNGYRLRAAERVRLEAGCTVKLANVPFRFVIRE